MEPGGAGLMLLLVLLELAAHIASPTVCGGIASSAAAGSASAETMPVELVEHAGGTLFSFGTPQFSLTFDATTLALRNLTACDGGREQGLLWPAGAADAANGFSLWQLNVSDCHEAIPYGVRLDALGSPTHTRRYDVTPLSAGASQLTLHWDGMSLSGSRQLVLDVAITITMQPASSQASLGATVSRHRPGICIQALTLPNLRVVSRTDAIDTLFVPWMFGQAGEAASNLPGWSGLELWRHPTFAVNGQLPLMPSAGGDSASMQWMAVYSNATGGDEPLGLYVGAHSPDSRLMMMLMESGASSTAVQFVHLPDDLSDNHSTSWELPFDVVLAGFSGNWWDAAQIYREWALSNAVWTRRGNLTTRAATETGYPQWLLRAPLWTQGGPAGNCGGCGSDNHSMATWLSDHAALVELIGAEIGCHWYAWEIEPLDTGDPVYTPRPGFTEDVAALQASGAVHVVPYTNGRVFDRREPKWGHDNASRFSCNHFRGGLSGTPRPYTEKYEAAANFSFAVMDPASAYWQKTIAGAAGTIALAHNVSGVYIDETASAYAQLCWHDNGSSGGAAWANGNRALLSATERAIGPNRAVISESNAEAYLGSLHAYLAIYGWQNCHMVPAFQAVYSGWSVNVGTEGWPLVTDTDGFRVVLAQQWQAGHVLGWTSPGQLLRAFAEPEDRAFLRSLCQLKV